MTKTYVHPNILKPVYYSLQNAPSVTFLLLCEVTVLTKYRIRNRQRPNDKKLKDYFTVPQFA